MAEMLPKASKVGRGHDAIRVADSLTFRKRTPFEPSKGGGNPEHVKTGKAAGSTHLTTPKACAYGVAGSKNVGR